jgi:hypothetical protein
MNSATQQEAPVDLAVAALTKRHEIAEPLVPEALVRQVVNLQTALTTTFLAPPVIPAKRLLTQDSPLRRPAVRLAQSTLRRDRLDWYLNDLRSSIRIGDP